MNKSEQREVAIIKQHLAAGLGLDYAARSISALISDTWQTQARGTNDVEYQMYLAFADDGKGGDITNNGAPLKTYDEWLNS